MAILLDLLLLLILILCTYLGYRRGFVRSFLSAISFLVSSLVALLFTAPLANFLYETFFYEAFRNAVNTALTNAHSFEAVEELLAVLENGSSEFCEILLRFGVTSADATQYVLEHFQLSAPDLQEGLVMMAAQPIANMAAVSTAFFVLFAAVYAVLKILRVALDLVAKLPILQQVNQLFGILFGAAYGILLVCLISSVLLYLWPMLSGFRPDTFAVTVPEQSILFGISSKYNLLSLLFGWMADANPHRILKGL